MLYYKRVTIMQAKGGEKMRIAICDDDRYCLQTTKEHIEKWLKGNCVDAEILLFNNADNLINACCKTPIDIIFLDIIMPMLTGMDAAKELRNIDKTAKIVFLTSSPEFALESYSVKASNYILKPVTFDKIGNALEDIISRINTEEKYLLAKTENGYQKISHKSIEFLEAQNKKVIIYLRNDTELEISEPFNEVEKKLTTNDGFFKCHRSYIVYLPSIDIFNSKEITTKSKRKIFVSRSYAKNLHEAYFSNMFDNK
ncbi:MAG: LytR/AlgR family response regulator transcription factor [Candidatus Gastranaerophilaceae bacterium]